MTDIVFIDGDKAVTSTLAISEGTGNQHKNVLDLVRTYLADLEEFGLVAFQTRPRSSGQHGGGDVEYAVLNEQQSTLLLTYMRNSEIVRAFKKRLVKRFWEMAREIADQKAKAAAPLSPAQMFLQSAQLMADIEQRQLQQAASVARIEQRVDEIEQGQILIARPANSEPITHIRKRIAAEYGLSSKVIDEVMRQSPYALKPAATVRNSREEAQGAVYTVWWIKDVTATFKRFVAESVKVSEAQYTHPYLSGRFRMNAPP